LYFVYKTFIYLLYKSKIIAMKEIRDLRKQKGITQERLASLSGVTTVTVNRAENSGKMRQSTYLKLLNTLNSLQDADHISQSTHGQASLCAQLHP